MFFLTSIMFFKSYYVINKYCKYNKMKYKLNKLNMIKDYGIYDKEI